MTTRFIIEGLLPRVYFIKAKTLGFIKIGRSHDVNTRLVQLQSTSPDELELLGSMPCVERTESILHEDFDEDCVRGEWFKSSEKLLAFIGKNCA